MCVMRMRRARLCPHTLTHTGRPPCCSADRQRACTPAPPDPAGRSRARRRPPPATAPPPTRPTAPQAARAPPSPLPPAARGCRLLASPPPFAAARSGPVRHRRSRPIDPSLGALSTPVLTSRTAGHVCSARVVPRCPWSAHTAAAAEPPGSSPMVNTVAPNDGRSREPAVGIDARSALPAVSLQARPCRRSAALSALASGERRARLTAWLAKRRELIHNCETVFFAGLQHAVTVLIRNDSNKYYTHIT